MLLADAAAEHINQPARGSSAQDGKLAKYWPSPVELAIFAWILQRRL